MLGLYRFAGTHPYHELSQCREAHPYQAILVNLRPLRQQVARCASRLDAGDIAQRETGRATAAAYRIHPSYGKGPRFPANDTDQSSVLGEERDTLAQQSLDMRSGLGMGE